LDAQITATLNRLPDGLPEIRIRNNSAAGLVAFVLRLNPVVQSDAHHAPLMVYLDTAVDATAMPLAPNQERRVPVPVRFRPGRHVEDLFEPPIVSAGILADGTTVGDAALLTRLVLRRSNMLQAVEMALETLSDAGRHNVPRGELIAQFRKMADSVSHWYLPPEQQVGRDLYQSIIGKLMNLPEEPVGSPFPPSTFVAEETAILNRQRVTLLESQPSLADAAFIAR
jgi:hypothetical protein